MEMAERDGMLAVMVDVQGRLAELVEGSEKLFADTRFLLQALHMLEVPTIYTEQIPAKMGATRPELSDLLGDCRRIEKSSFSCCGSDDFMRELARSGRRQLAIFGIEAHICVCQTALELLQSGYEVFVVADAVASRSASEKDAALARLRAAGAELVSIEMLVYELLRDAADPVFKEILQLVKGRLQY
jgi:hypothetical protein